MDGFDTAEVVYLEAVKSREATAKQSGAGQRPNGVYEANFIMVEEISAINALASASIITPSHVERIKASAKRLADAYAKIEAAVVGTRSDKRAGR